MSQSWHMGLEVVGEEKKHLLFKAISQETNLQTADAKGHNISTLWGNFSKEYYQ